MIGTVLFSALAEFERDLIRERTSAGLRAARAQGRFGGRKRQTSPEEVQTAAAMMANQRLPIPEICKALGVSLSALYRYVGPRGEIRVP